MRWWSYVASAVVGSGGVIAFGWIGWWIVPSCAALLGVVVAAGARRPFV